MYMHHEELHNLYSSLGIFGVIKSNSMRWAGYLARMGEIINAYKCMVGNPEGTRPLGSPRRGWEDNMKMNLKEIG
jgi:hypothetical protein